MIRSVIITMMTLVASINAEPLLLLAGQLDQLQKNFISSKAPSLELEKVSITDLENLIQSVESHIKSMGSSEEKKTSMEQILAEWKTQSNMQQLITWFSAYLQERYRGSKREWSEIDNPYNKVRGLWKRIITLSQDLKIDEADIDWLDGVSAAWNKTYNELSDKNNIRDKYKKWLENCYTWDPKDTVDNMEAIYAQCSWDGLANLIGTSRDHDEIIDKLKDVRVKDEDNLEAKINHAIVQKGRSIVRSLIWEAQKIDAYKKQIAELNKFDKDSVISYVRQLISRCQAMTREEEEKYEMVKALYEKANLDVSLTWCTVLRSTSFSIFKDVMKQLAQKLLQKRTSFGSTWDAMIDEINQLSKALWKYPGCDLSDDIELNKLKEKNVVVNEIFLEHESLKVKA